MQTPNLKRLLILILLVVFILVGLPIIGIFLGVRAEDVTLQWDSNTEPDLAGYQLHYSKQSPSPPYTGTGGSVKGVVSDSPVTLPIFLFSSQDICEISIIDLEDCRGWYFAVTAYDTQQLVSGYSNVVNTPIYLRNFREKGE